MKKTSVTGKVLVVIGVVAMLLVPAANAQSTGRFDIPFEFWAGGKVLPAGEYQVKVELGSHLMALRQIEGDAFAYFLGTPSYSRGAAPPAATLAFHQSGGVYVLASVRMRDSSRGLDLPAENARRQLANGSGAVTVAYVAESARFGDN